MSGFVLALILLTPQGPQKAIDLFPTREQCESAKLSVEDLLRHSGTTVIGGCMTREEWRQ